MKTIFTIALLFTIASFSISAQQVDINTSSSSLAWLGKKIGGKHDGHIKIKSGHVQFKNEKIIAGEIVIDMTQISNQDIESKDKRQALIDHLESDDFFDVQKYPTATFVLSSISPFINGKATASGKLTIKGITKKISFDVTQLGKDYLAKIELDRSKFNVRYGSDSFFDNLGDSVIDDIFTLDIKIVLKH